MKSRQNLRRASLDAPGYARAVLAILCALAEAFGGKTFDNAIIAIPVLTGDLHDEDTGDELEKWHSLQETAKLRCQKRRQANKLEKLEKRMRSVSSSFNEACDEVRWTSLRLRLFGSSTRPKVTWPA
eukprot:g17138.t1